jgi:hypothetical protein
MMSINRTVYIALSPNPSPRGGGAKKLNAVFCGTLLPQNTAKNLQGVGCEEGV